MIIHLHFTGWVGDNFYTKTVLLHLSSFRSVAWSLVSLDLLRVRIVLTAGNYHVDVPQGCRTVKTNIKFNIKSLTSNP